VSRLTAWRVMTPMAPDDERVLVARLRACDIRAFDEVYKRVPFRVFAFLLRMIRSRTVAEAARRNMVSAGAPRGPAAPRHTSGTLAVHGRAQSVWK
jgi:hypothetical protein